MSDTIKENEMREVFDALRKAHNMETGDHTLVLRFVRPVDRDDAKRALQDFLGFEDDATMPRPALQGGDAR